MAGGSAGTTPGTPVTSGGWSGMNGAQRRLALLSAAGFVAVVLMVMVANAESTISDLRAANASVPAHLIWSWEWTSIVGWLSLTPALWWAAGRMQRLKPAWPLALLAVALGSVLASAWHIAVMVALRHVYYAAMGEGPYRFFGVIDDRIAYEYRKDLVTFVQFVLIAFVVRWMIDRNADIPPGQHAAAATPRHVVVADGSSRISVPVDEIESVSSAGNYVELDWAGRTLLHRATLAAMEADLDGLFVRVHRRLLVRVGAIRTVEVDRSGDFTATLASGATVRGSRRYRDNLRRWSGRIAE